MGECRHTSKEQHEALESVAHGLLDAYCPLCLADRLSAALALAKENGERAERAEANAASFEQCLFDETKELRAAMKDVGIDYRGPQDGYTIADHFRKHCAALRAELKELEDRNAEQFCDMYALRAELARKTEALEAIGNADEQYTSYAQARALARAAIADSPKAGGQWDGFVERVQAEIDRVGPIDDASCTAGRPPKAGGEPQITAAYPRDK